MCVIYFKWLHTVLEIQQSTDLLPRQLCRYRKYRHPSRWHQVCRRPFSLWSIWPGDHTGPITFAPHPDVKQVDPSSPWKRYSWVAATFCYLSCSQKLKQKDQIWICAWFCVAVRRIKINRLRVTGTVNETLLL